MLTVPEGYSLVLYGEEMPALTLNFRYVVMAVNAELDKKYLYVERDGPGSIWDSLQYFSEAKYLPLWFESLDAARMALLRHFGRYESEVWLVSGDSYIAPTHGSALQKLKQGEGSRHLSRALHGIDDAYVYLAVDGGAGCVCSKSTLTKLAYHKSELVALLELLEFRKIG